MLRSRRKFYYQLGNNTVNSSIRSFFILAFTIISLSACTPLQSRRLDTAEDYIVEAEQILAGPPHHDQVKVADDTIGSAKAYLLTLKDFKKRLNSHELKRYKVLQQRANGVTNRIKSMK